MREYRVTKGDRVLVEVRAATGIVVHDEVRQLALELDGKVEIRQVTHGMWEEVVRDNVYQGIKP